MYESVNSSEKNHTIISFTMNIYSTFSPDHFFWSQFSLRNKSQVLGKDERHLARTSGNSSMAGFGLRVWRGLLATERRDLTLTDSSLRKLIYTVILTKVLNVTIIFLVAVTVNFATYR